MRPVHFNACTYELLDPDGLLCPKECSLWTNAPELSRLASRCPGCSSEHSHGPGPTGKVWLHGQWVTRAALAAIYPPRFVRAYADAVAALCEDFLGSRAQ